MTILENVIQLFDRAVELNTTVQFETVDGMFRDYHDPSGQRLCYLEHYGISYENNKKYVHPMYVIKRRLAFENKSDEGKEGAVIGVFYIKEPEDKYKAEEMLLSIDRKRQMITVGNFIFRFRADLKSPNKEKVIL